MLWWLAGLLGLVGALFFVLNKKAFKVHPADANSAILITGCDSGIGRATAEKFLQEGFTVIATVFTEEGNSSLHQYASGNKAANRLATTRTDITDDKSVENLDQFVGDYLKKNPGMKLVGLVNNAGIALSGPLEAQPIGQFRRQVEVNLFGHVHVAQKMTKYLRECQGRLINVTSMAGRAAARGMGAYAASKFALEAVSDVQRLELSRWGISVSAIEPGFMRTPLVTNAFGGLEQNWKNLLEARELYAPELERTKKSGARILGYAPSPSLVADKIFHGITAKYPLTRYRVGKDAAVINSMLWMPDRVRDRIVDLF